MCVCVYVCVFVWDRFGVGVESGVPEQKEDMEVDVEGEEEGGDGEGGMLPFTVDLTQPGYR